MSQAHNKALAGFASLKYGKRLSHLNAALCLQEVRIMKYTKNQHMLSQWFLRNFRSDDTANAPKDKQRV
ncbi:hypothetical protein AKH07_22920 [Vibrio parahaemolyticus]|nr:hypothetical protein AKH07_22920 [Vibrio parahaemolyticus]